MSNQSNPAILKATDFHVLLVLREKPLYGYAIKKAVTEESDGTVAPQIGTLYRVLARLMNQGLVEEMATPPDSPDVHPGLDRRYYRITPSGDAAVRAEATRLEKITSLARRRGLLPQGRRT